jgi:phage terminase large subunit
MTGTPLLEKTLLSDKKIIIHRGGTRSSKTYTINQLCAFWLMTGNYQDGAEPHKTGTWTTVRKYRTNLDSTCLKDFIEILHNEGWYDLITHNKTKKTFKFQGREVEFIGADDEQKLRGAKRKILYCNEANELQYKKEFFQLLMRTEDKIILDFNPDDEQIWINTELEQKRKLDKGDVELIVSNYNDNTFLPQSLVDEIEYLQETDPEFWKIYGLGEYGNITGLIMESSVIESIPDNADLIGYGLDFGFSLDPTSLVAVYKHDKDLYFDEVIYETNLTNQDIYDKIKDIVGRDEIIADSAEPKSIEELFRMGLNIKPCVKGKDSIIHGIDVLKRFNLNVTERSLNIRKEFRSYKWATDKTGNSTGKPIDKFNHSMDALRYLVSYKLKHNNSGKYFLYS